MYGKVVGLHQLHFCYLCLDIEIDIEV